MADSYRTFVQIEVPPGNAADEVAALEVGHFTDGPRDGMARFEVSFRDEDRPSLVLPLGPIAAAKLGAALLAASFDHRAALERWQADT